VIAFSRLRFGIAVQGNKTPEEYVALAQLIDAYAFDVVSVYNDLYFQPAIGPLLVMAPHVRSAQLGPAALNPYTLHPVEIAGQIAFLDFVTHGRAYLGLARGAWLDQVGVAQPRPLHTMRQAILQIKSLWSGAALRYARSREAAPITIGTWGARMAKLAGELAEEVKIGGSTNPSMAAHLMPFIRQGEVTAGRSAGTVGLCLGAVTVVDGDRAAARRKARDELALYAPVVAQLDPSLRDADWIARIKEPAQRGDSAAVAALIPDAVLDRLAFAGTPGDIARQAEDLARVGVTRVEFGTPHGLDPRTGIRLLGERVLPSFSR
jgi:5,10-methylenetetrahydromethanopterin reductase